MSPDFAVKDAYGDAFAPGYEISDGFPNPDQVVNDYNAMTFTSFKQSAQEDEDYVDAMALDQRLRQIPVPLLSVFGDEDQICDPASSPGRLRGGPRRAGRDRQGGRALTQRREARRDRGADREASPPRGAPASA